jgi:hypothetical protein
MSSTPENDDNASVGADNEEQGPPASRFGSRGWVIEKYDRDEAARARGREESEGTQREQDEAIALIKAVIAALPNVEDSPDESRVFLTRALVEEIGASPVPEPPEDDGDQAALRKVLSQVQSQALSSDQRALIVSASRQPDFRLNLAEAVGLPSLWGTPFPGLEEIEQSGWLKRKWSGWKIAIEERRKRSAETRKLMESGLSKREIRNKRREERERQKEAELVRAGFRRTTGTRLWLSMPRIHSVDVANSPEYFVGRFGVQEVQVLKSVAFGGFWDIANTFERAGSTTVNLDAVYNLHQFDCWVR